MILGEKTVTKVGADETRSTSDQDAQTMCSFFIHGREPAQYEQRRASPPRESVAAELRRVGPLLDDIQTNIQTNLGRRDDS